VTIKSKPDVDLSKVDGFVQKPSKRKDLLGGIRKVLK